MAIYVLVDHLDTHCSSSVNTRLFEKKEQAQAAMREMLEKTIKDWSFDKTMDTADHSFNIHADSAIIWDGRDFETWKIEEKEVERFVG